MFSYEKNNEKKLEYFNYRPDPKKDRDLYFTTRVRGSGSVKFWYTDS